MDMEKCRRLIGAHTPIAPPKIKQDEFQTIIETLKTETVQPPQQELHQKNYYTNI